MDDDDFINSISGEGLSEELPAGEIWADDEFEVLIGEAIGSGGARDVFEVKDNPGAVIKKAKPGRIGSNFAENFVWNAVRKTKYGKLFGRILAASPTGNYLMMERLNDFDRDEVKSTPTLPDFVRDCWINNFGRNSSGEIKIRDYGQFDFTDIVNNAPAHRHPWQK